MQENTTTERLTIPLTIYTDAERGVAEISNRTCRLFSVLSAIRYLADAQGLLEASNGEPNMPYGEFTFVTRHLCEIAQAFTDDLEGSLPGLLREEHSESLSLAEHISAVLKHKDTPTALYNALSDELADLQPSDIDTPEMIQRALDLRAARESKGGAA